MMTKNSRKAESGTWTMKKNKLFDGPDEAYAAIATLFILASLAFAIKDIL